jgi:hypothetical protein
MDETNPTPAPEPTPTPAPTPEPTIHPAEFRKLKKEREELAKRLEAIEADRKKAADASMTELDRIKAERDELAKIRDEHTSTVKLLEADRDERIAALPEEIRKVAEEAIDGLRLDAQLRQLKVFASLAGKAVAPRDARVERGGPAPAKRLPTASEIEANPDLLKGRSFAELQEIAQANGIGAASNNPFGFKR